MLDCEADTATLGKTAGKDSDNDKPTYVKLMGLQAARAYAETLTAEAVALLEPLRRKSPASAAAGGICYCAEKLESGRPKTTFMNDFERIYNDWHEFAKNRDTARLISLYDDNAVSKARSFLIMQRQSGILRGKADILAFRRRNAPPTE